MGGFRGPAPPVFGLAWNPPFIAQPQGDASLSRRLVLFHLISSYAFPDGFTDAPEAHSRQFHIDRSGGHARSSAPVLRIIQIALHTQVRHFDRGLYNQLMKGVYRLWHQLTKKLFEFYDHPQALPFRVDVFERFVRDFETKLNQLRLAELGVKVAKDIESTLIEITTNLFFLPPYLFARSPIPPFLPDIIAIADRHRESTGGTCPPPRLDRTRKVAVW